MNRTIQIMVCVLGILFLTVAPGIAQAPNTFLPPSGTWHLDINWSYGNIPEIDEDVLIPGLKTCIISTDDAVARTVSVTGALAVTSGQVLQIRTPNAVGTPSLTVNTNVYVNADGVIRFEDVGGDDIARIVGSGWLSGNGNPCEPGVLATVTGANAVDWIHVDEDVTVFGDLLIAASIDNDGMFLTAGDNLDMTFDHPTGVMTITGSGDFVNFGRMRFGCIDFDSGTLDATFAAFDVTMTFFGCGAEVKPDLDDATLLVDGGRMDFDDGFTMTGGAVIVSDGLLWCEGDVEIANTSVTVDETGVFALDTAFMKVNSASTIVVEDAGWLAAVDIITGLSGSGIAITVRDSGKLSCDWFDFNETDLTIVSGLFDVAGFGSQDFPSEGSISVDITLQGGTFKIAWGYDGHGALTVVGGTLDILADDESALEYSFRNDGGIQFLGGSIKVAQDESLLIE